MPLRLRQTLLFEYRRDINQAFYVTAAPYSVQNHAFTGELLHKTDIFCHSDLYSTLQKKRPSTKSRKSCRTVLFYGAFELFWPASITKMTQKMMDGFIRDTIRWQMNSLRSTVVGVYACRQLKAGDAAQPKGCSARFLLWCAHQFAGVVHKNGKS